MCKRSFVVLCLVLSAALITLSVGGQEAQTPRTQAPRYKFTTEVNVTGVVQEVKHQASPTGLLGTHLIVWVGSEKLDVHLGLTRSEKVQFFPGDLVEVTGSRLRYANADLVLAREIKKGDQVLILRNSRGIVQPSRANHRITLLR